MFLVHGVAADVEAATSAVGLEDVVGLRVGANVRAAASTGGVEDIVGLGVVPT